MEAIFISCAKIRLYFTPFSGEWATRKWMFCRKIFRAAVEPFEVNFWRRDGCAADLEWAVWRPQHGGSNGDDGHVGHFEFSPPDLEQRQLLSVRLAQIADAQTQQPQRSRNQFVPAQQETTQPVEVICLSDRFLD